MSGLIGSAGSKSGVIGTTELDYEEGTWTVTAGGASVTNLGATLGYYFKIGNRVFFDFYSSASTFTSPSGSAYITLPFTSASGRYPLFTYEHGNAIDGSARGGFVAPDSNRAYWLDAGNYTQASFIAGSSKYLMVSGNYLIQ